MEYNGVKLEPGLALLFPTRSVHRDPRYWPDPLTYNPDRFAEKPLHPMAYQTFGDGPRNCVGMRMALLSMKLAICHVLPKMKLVLNEECKWRSRSILSQPEKLMVTVGFAK